jgi:hypothetical protein
MLIINSHVWKHKIARHWMWASFTLSSNFVFPYMW